VSELHDLLLIHTGRRVIVDEKIIRRQIPAGDCVECSANSTYFIDGESADALVLAEEEASAALEEKILYNIEPGDIKFCPGDLC
jgi:hypothetical protein